MVPANWGLTTGDLTYRGLTTRSLTSGGPTNRAPTSRGPTSKGCTTRGLTYRSFTVGGISSSRLDFLRSLRFSFPVTVAGPSASEGRSSSRSLVRFSAAVCQESITTKRSSDSYISGLQCIRHLGYL